MELLSKKVVIVGGGTAGWLTALVVRKAFPDLAIDLVESSQIGILGAGEGSTPHLLHALNYADVDMKDLIQNTSCTLKNGILFDGWSKTHKSYLHGFDVYDRRFNKEMFNDEVAAYDWTSAPLLPYLSDYVGIEESKIDFLTQSSLKNKALFVPTENDGLSQVGVFAIHFDAQSIAEYMAKVAMQKNVNRIEGKVSNIDRDEAGNITKLVLDSGQEVGGEFFFDCTGFARLIIGKLYESEWVSFKDSLPAKRAMPFFLPPEKDFVQPYTHAKAMSKGWIWKIPLQHRYGCGYVYDPDQISDDDVKKEIDEFAGFEVEVPRMFNFEPGYYKKVWIKNCLALGLSNGFVEPLEATSIMQLLFALQTFLAQKHKIFSDDQVYKDNFNRQIEEDHRDIEAFIYLHYMTDKDDNDFWSNFTSNYRMPDRLVPTAERIERGVLNMRDGGGIFDVVSHVTVAKGNGLFTQENLEGIYSSLERFKFTEAFDKIIADMDQTTDRLMPHRDLLEKFGAKFD